MSETLEITVSIVHSPPDVRVIGETASTLRVVDNAAEVAGRAVTEEIGKRIPADHVCSLVVAVEGPDGVVTLRHDYLPDDKDYGIAL